MTLRIRWLLSLLEEWCIFLLFLRYQFNTEFVYLLLSFVVNKNHHITHNIRDKNRKNKKLKYHLQNSHFSYSLSFRIINLYLADEEQHHPYKITLFVKLERFEISWECHWSEWASWNGGRCRNSNSSSSSITNKQATTSRTPATREIYIRVSKSKWFVGVFIL